MNKITFQKEFEQDLERRAKSFRRTRSQASIPPAQSSLSRDTKDAIAWAYDSYQKRDIEVKNMDWQTRMECVGRVLQDGARGFDEKLDNLPTEVAAEIVNAFKANRHYDPAEPSFIGSRADFSALGLREQNDLIKHGSYKVLD